MLRLAFSLLLLCTTLPAFAQATADTASSDTTSAIPKKEIAGHQFVLGIDIISPVRNMLVTGQNGYQFAADYYLHNEFYLAAEGGWGSSDVTYDDLKYHTSNAYFSAGFNKILLPREDSTDWGGLFMGLRLGAAPIQRSAATYTIIDSLWGNTSGTIAPKNFTGYWMEITAGVRVELYKGLLAGWNIRGKFMMNGKQFNDLAPLYITGYGRGDKNAVFDINFYLSYAVRWKRKR